MTHVIGVAAVIHDGMGNVLLQHRKKDPGSGLYVLPGGRLDEADPQIGIARECKEELALAARPYSFAQVMFATDTLGDGSPLIMLYFYTKINRRIEVLENLEPDKCHGLHWFSYLDLPFPKMWANDARACMAANRLHGLQALSWSIKHDE